jgi:hypothetical protein
VCLAAYLYFMASPFALLTITLLTMLTNHELNLRLHSVDEREKNDSKSLVSIIVLVFLLLNLLEIW